MISGRKLGFYANGNLRQLPIGQMCQFLKETGYDAVELDRAWLDAQPNERDLRAELETIRSCGLELSEVIVQLDYVNQELEVREKAVEDTLGYLRSCANAGIGTVNLFTGPRPWMPNAPEVGKTVSLSDAWGMVFSAFDRLVPAAEELGVQLAVENVWGMVCHDFFTMQFLVSHYNSPNLGVNFDPSHDVLAGNRDMEFLLRQWGRDRIKHIHLKDAAGTQVKGNVLFPPLGEGFVDWQSFSRGLDAIGYDGVLSVEYEAGQQLEMALQGDWCAAAKDCYTRLKKLL